MSSIQPVTFYVPSSAAEPIEVDVAHSGLRMVLVSREAIHMLDQSWAVLGVYFLLGPTEDPDRYRAYVGEVGRRTLLVRIKEHAAQKDFWNRALLIASASDNFNSAEIGWLEGRLYDVLNNAVAAEIVNRGRPGDDSIAARDRGVLERYVEPIVSALRACGASPDTADQKPAPRGRRKQTRYSESVKDLIDARLLKAGTRLVPLRRGLSETALVLDDGSLEVTGARFEHVSPAAMAVSGKKAEPGWDFWGAPSGDGGHVPLAKLRQRLREGAANSATAPAAPASATSGAAPPSVRTGEHAAPANASAPAASQTASRPTSAPGGPTEDRAQRPRGDAAGGAVEGAQAKRKSRRVPRADGGEHRARYKLTATDLIDAGDLHKGEKLVATDKGQRYETTLLPDGRARGVGAIADASVSTVASKLCGRAINGWDFWCVERDGRLAKLAEIRAARTAASAATDESSQVGEK